MVHNSTIMNEGTIIIIIGLGFDIVGAYIVLKPLIHLYKRYWGNQTPDLKSKELRIGSYDKNIVESQNRDMKDAKIGFTLLAIGFTIQIFGNLIQTPPS